MSKELKKKTVRFNPAERIGSFTGANDKAGNHTIERFSIGGTDLGMSINIPNGDTLLLFGDTFSQETPKSDISGGWRTGAILRTSDTDLSDGLQIDSAWTRWGFKNFCFAENPVDSTHDNGEGSRIYVGGVEVNGNLYAFCFSWNSAAESPLDRANYGTFIKSTDEGVTWERVPDLTFVGYSYDKGPGGSGITVAEMENVVNRGLKGERNVYNIDIKAHEAYGFTQIYPVDGKDGYIYFFGRGGHPGVGLRLARVSKEEFENFKAIEYLIGYENDGSPIWGKNPNDAILILEGRNRNSSVIYNKYAQKWVLGYLNCHEVSKYPLEVRHCDNIWGPYSEPSILFENAGENRNHYGVYMNERWVDDKGNYYFIYSRWTRSDPYVYRSFVGKGTVDLLDEE